MRSLASYMEVAREYLVETSQTFDPGCDFEERLEAYRTYCLSLKMLAYGKLLVECDVPQFFGNLLRAAANWRELLAQIDASDPGQRVPASMNDPLLGALACNRMELAAELAELSARELTPPEYDDEFYSAFFLQEVLRSSFGRRSEGADFEELCRRIDDSLGEQSPRTDVYRALAARDGPAFEASFKAWNEVSATALSDPDAPGATFSTGITRHIWLEGLGTLKLAEAVGLKVGRELRPLLPELVLHPPASLPKLDPWLLGRSRLTEEDV